MNANADAMLSSLHVDILRKEVDSREEGGGFAGMGIMSSTGKNRQLFEGGGGTGGGSRKFGEVRGGGGGGGGMAFE
jgi:hypothetical protein